MLAWLCQGKGADLHMAQLMPLLLTISCSRKSRLVFIHLPGFTFLVPAHPDTHTHTQPFYGSVDLVRDNPGEPVPEGRKTVCVYACVRACMRACM